MSRHFRLSATLCAEIIEFLGWHFICILLCVAVFATLEVIRMQIIYYENIEKFYKKAQPLLKQKPVLYAQMLSIIHSILRNPSSYGDHSPYALLVVDEHGQTVGAALRTPPFPLLVTEMPQVAADALALKLEELDQELPGVLGPASDSWKFAKMFSNGSRIPELRLHMKLYCLREVEHNWRRDARLQRCEPADLDHLYPWVCQFAKDCQLPQGAPARERVEAMVERGEYFYWETNQGRVALLRRYLDEDAQSARIGSVYTPIHFRGNGYGTDGTAALTQQCLNEGARYVTLVADMKNPTSNGIYQKVGYRAVSDMKLFEFQGKEQEAAA